MGRRGRALTVILLTIVGATDSGTLSPETWQRVSSLFVESLEVPDDARQSFLLRKCGGDSELLDEVRQLLAEHDRAGRFLQTAILQPPAPSADSHSFSEGALLAGRFRIVRLLGAGGMGEVYEAHDCDLGHNVAIKTLREPLALDPDMAQRFRTEVLRSRQITHRNVARAYDLFTDRSKEGVDRPFFTMELIPGRTLAEHMAAEGPFSPASAHPLLEQMAVALDAAHAAGIVHRDFKPGNVFLTPEGVGEFTVKVTDFGIAGETGEREGAGPHEGAATLTQVAGTPAYMAPEQLDGEPGTPASDVYALGLVAFEMISGERAFSASSPLVCWLEKSAPRTADLCEGRAGVPARWASAIARATRQDPRERFARAPEFVAAIRGGAGKRRGRLLAAAAAITLASAAVYVDRTNPWAKPHPASLAVLPLASDGAERSYLGAGVAESLARSLAAYPNTRVAPLNAASAYQQRNIRPGDIARNLKVEYVLSGSLSQSGNRLHLTAQVVEGASGKQLWSQSYDCEAEQLLLVEPEIAQAVARRFSLGKPSPKASRPPTANAEAYDLFMRGRFLGNTRSKEGLKKSIDYLTRALTLDRDFALAYAELGESYEMLFEYGWIPAADSGPHIRESLVRALALDPENAFTVALSGLFNFHVEWNQPEAERAFQRALLLDPNVPEAHHWYASYLWHSGRFDEALREAGEARRLDPVTLPTLLVSGWVQYGRRDYPAAIEICKQALELNPNYSSAWQLMAQSYAEEGQIQQALEASNNTLRIDTDRGVALRHRAFVLSRLPGYEGEARRVTAELEALSQDRQAGYLARIYAALRDRERMYRWADRAVELHDIGLLESNVDPVMDRYRNEAHFQEILRKIGLH